MDKNTLEAARCADAAESVLATAQEAYRNCDYWVLANAAKNASDLANKANEAAIKFEEEEGRGREEPEASKEFRRAARAAAQCWVLAGLTE